MMECREIRGFSTPWKHFFHTVENRVRCPQACHAMGVDVDAEDFFWILAGSKWNSSFFILNFP
ncbi:MAG TPA: hypothetical protein PLJ99_03315 [Kiritimatiellia bacterium]|nr:hypothetical protein [Kiritimatiellia bacterium]HPR68299.1 hypothetical protein [Kiritimatiellia bacterium]